jgi:hypothetical protein
MGDSHHPDAESRRLAEDAARDRNWKRWGPYLSERQWGTVREDYSPGGTAWDFFPHDHARSRAYRWGEDGIGGISDRHQLICFAVTLWNGRDPILKERLFGLTGPEGNHGEDVKEIYYYLDSTPTHSYMRFLYKYPQAAYPYSRLVEENRRRGRSAPEFELIDTGVFADDRYFDVFVEYAKADAEDILIRIDAVNRGPETATLHLLPTLWFRNTWSWGGDPRRPRVAALDGTSDTSCMEIRHEYYGERRLWCEGSPEMLFTENESDCERLWGIPSESPYVKDAFEKLLVHGQKEAVNPERSGTKAAFHHVLAIAPHATATVRLRLTSAEAGDAPFGAGVERLFAERRREAAIEFYAPLAPRLPADARS